MGTVNSSPIGFGAAASEPPPAVPAEIQVIETLMTALDLARSTSDPMLPRLIEAVLLHAGRELARGLAEREPGSA